MSPLDANDKESITNAVKLAVLEAFDAHREKDHDPLVRLVYIGVGGSLVLSALAPLLWGK